MGTLTQSLKHSDKPEQYIKGWVEFYKLKFKVDGRVLIPRPETELLVDEVFNFTKHQLTNNQPTILDLGTGSGNIAIALAKNLPKTKIFATDISAEALELAKENAKLNKVQDRIFFLKGDLLSVILEGAKRSIESTKRSYHPDKSGFQDNNLVIVTNLPYIPRGRIPYLDPPVKDFEPWIALDGGQDGFDLYRKLFQQIVEKNLKPKLIVGEIDYTHGELAIQEAQTYFPKAEVEVRTDLAQKQRILLIKLDHSKVC